MEAERRRLLRLQRLERHRAVTRRIALAEAGAAERTRSHLAALATRASRLAADYAGLPEPDGLDAGALGRLMVFGEGLRAIERRSAQDAANAAAAADAKLQALAEAEHRRAAVEKRVAEQQRVVSGRQGHVSADVRRRPGTVLD